ncbi:sulfotransferase family protein [Synechococcus sp. BS55D]|uniref:sulfotransferase family protein n=1 Tax=Synechococcus sp. BS55D TaxID=2055943 RepID=UPI0010E3A746|nr:hypothetical protein [Synechococcus sp. BS55D]TCD58060.1 hypothetical protein CWE16_01795 [Synechococcus sp. BS55D]
MGRVQPPLILLLGMHRSGTSLLAGLLQRLGVALPGTLIAADAHNPSGYFEWREVVDLQEQLLVDLERWWPAAEGLRPLPEGWLDHPATRAAAAQLQHLLSAEQARQQGPWLIKDPRSSRLLPLWLGLAEALELPLHLVLSIRDPAEVVTSLMRRDRVATGMDALRAQRLWWLHNQEVLAALPPGQALTLVDYSAWFSSPEQQLERLLTALPDLQPREEQRLQALALIDPRLQRSGRTPLQVRALDEPVEVGYRRLQAGARSLEAWPGARIPSLEQQDPELAAGDLADPHGWRDWCDRHHSWPAPRRHPPLPVGNCLHVQVLGRSRWKPRLGRWLRRLPLSVCPEASTRRIALNFSVPAPAAAQQWQQQLAQAELIWDPDPSRVRLLRALGYPAYWLDPAAPPHRCPRRSLRPFFKSKGH